MTAQDDILRQKVMDWQQNMATRGIGGMSTSSMQSEEPRMLGITQAGLSKTDQQEQLQQSYRFSPSSNAAGQYDSNHSRAAQGYEPALQTQLSKNGSWPTQYVVQDQLAFVGQWSNAVSGEKREKR